MANMKLQPTDLSTGKQAAHPRLKVLKSIYQHFR